MINNETEIRASMWSKTRTLTVCLTKAGLIPPHTQTHISLFLTLTRKTDLESVQCKPPALYAPPTLIISQSIQCIATCSLTTEPSHQ